MKYIALIAVTIAVETYASPVTYVFVAAALLIGFIVREIIDGLCTPNS